MLSTRCGRSIMVIYDLPKVEPWVRFPSPALVLLAPLVQWQNGGIVNRRRQSDSDRGLKLFLNYFMLPPQTSAPDFTLPDQNAVDHKLSTYLGQWVLLYFYPKDDTPGCTIEACSVQDNLSKFDDLKIKVLGISADPISSHQKFAQKYALNFTLLSDDKKEVISKYEAGGIFTKRISYLIDPQGEIFKAYENVNPETHVPEVLEDLNGILN